MRSGDLDVVIGAGALGRATARALMDMGRPVRVVSRSGGAAVHGAEGYAADVRDRASLRPALAGAARVYGCMQPPYHRWVDEFPALQRAVLAGAEAAGADVILADNLYTYGRPDGVITEDSPRRPSTRKGRLRLEMAGEALRAHAAGRARVALVRPSNFFGPGYERSEQDIFAPALAGAPMMFLGRPDQPHSFTYILDAGQAMAAVGLGSTGWGRAWIAPVQSAMTQADFAQRVWRAAGQSGEPRLRMMGPRMARVIGLLDPVARELGEMMYEFTEPFVVDASATATEFGIRPTPLAEAVEASLAAARDARALTRG